MTESSPPGGVNHERFVLTESREDLERLHRSLLGDVEAQGYDRTCCFAIRLALEEALSNAFKHGNQSDPDKKVTVRWRAGAERVEVEVEDQGEGFDPDTVPDPTLEENIEIPCGRGIVLMRAYMTDVRFHPPGNRVEMTFERPVADETRDRRRA